MKNEKLSPATENVNAKANAKANPAPKKTRKSKAKKDVAKEIITETTENVEVVVEKKEIGRAHV